MSLFFCISLAASALAATRSPAVDYLAFRNSTLAKIEANSIAATSKSWELGTNFAALTYRHAYNLSEFGTVEPTYNTSFGKLPTAVIDGLDDVLNRRSRNTKLLAFMVDGAAADPASMLPAAVIAGITTGESKYTDAARDQIQHLLDAVPRYSDNITLSHRNTGEPFQAWADSVFMVPPTIGSWAAYVGGDEGANLMWFAYAQIKGYRNLLQDKKTNLWRHIVEGNWEDRGFWLTGNAWAAFGALRLEATISKSEYADNMTSEIADLREWTDEILNATWWRQQPSGGLKNYLKEDTFEDSAGLALIAAATYRYSLITKSDKYIPFAEKAFTRLIDLVDEDGWVASPVDPYNFRTVGEHSPEAQSFLLILHVMSKRYYRWQESAGRATANALLHGLSLKKAAAV